jgi:ABC-2 type transport system permease protein
MSVGPSATLWATFVRAVASRARLAGFAAVVALVVAVAARAGSGGISVHDAVAFIDLVGVSFAAPVAALVFGVGVLGDLVDDGTLVDLWLRPVARWRLASSAAVAAWTLAIPMAMVPVLAGCAVLGTSDRVTAAAVLATFGAVVAYSSLFVWLGLVSRRALVWGIGYLLIIEQFAARGGKGLGALSIRAHALSIVSGRTGVDVAVGYFTPLTSGIVLAVITLVGVAATVLTLRTRDVA